LQYDNFFGKLYGNLDPPGVWIYGQKITFHPTSNLELGFSRNAVIGGEGTSPITFGNFFHSLTSTTSGTCAGCSVRENPGARHANFDFTYRLPWVRNWLTLYADSFVHDDLSPIDAPRRAAVTPGIYLSHFPAIPKLDLHVEGGTTDTVTSRALGGQFYYYELIYRDGYTNKGNLLGSWLGREGTGGNAWATYWMNANSTFQLGYRYLKTSHFFVPHGERQQDAYGQLNYTFHNGVGLRLFAQVEHWKAPVLAPSALNNGTIQVQLSFRPQGWNRP